MDLIKLDNQKWKIVIDNSNKGVMECSSIESAAEMLEVCGVQEKDIDRAICELFALGHNRAKFNANGHFIVTSLEK